MQETKKFLHSFQSTISREKFEELCDDLWEESLAPVKEVLKHSDLKVNDIYAVELIVTKGVDVFAEHWIITDCRSVLIFIVYYTKHVGKRTVVLLVVGSCSAHCPPCHAMVYYFCNMSDITDCEGFLSSPCKVTTEIGSSQSATTGDLVLVPGGARHQFVSYYKRPWLPAPEVQSAWSLEEAEQSC
ncbi:hypothetical protein IEQ34_022508 [Dendrobium chrysotoxum]|uniref:Uncharacterized protein n=1 Tax=Dendrobium chrysotoxum TaxID=161865 RepID=A0AAV7FZ22_DENCH|nr:hypothetical protein IEQ34_022508 [Dendrobium chrysotoxum]